MGPTATAVEATRAITPAVNAPTSKGLQTSLRAQRSWAGRRLDTELLIDGVGKPETWTPARSQGWSR